MHYEQRDVLEAAIQVYDMCIAPDALFITPEAVDVAQGIRALLDKQPFQPDNEYANLPITMFDALADLLLLRLGDFLPRFCVSCSAWNDYLAQQQTKDKLHWVLDELIRSDTEANNSTTNLIKSQPFN
jgi:hypothetical protein